MYAKACFLSVSLDPKLMVISIKENAQMLNKIKISNHLAINILAEDHQKLSLIFAGHIK